MHADRYVSGLTCPSLSGRHTLTTFTGAWLKLGSCADIWISSVAKGSDLIGASKLVHLPGSRCTSQDSSSSANLADASDGRGDGNARRSGSFESDMMLLVLG